VLRRLPRARYLSLRDSRHIEPEALAPIAGTSQIARLTVTSAVRLIAEADSAHLQA